MEATSSLKKIGLNEKEAKIYLTLSELGPTSVRMLAKATGVNRGTAYDVLKSLQAMGVVSYYHKATKQYFAAEDPNKLVEAAEKKIKDLAEIKKNIINLLPELRSLQNKAGAKPVVKYYEGYQGVKTILQDVLEATDTDKEVIKKYYVFSASSIRPYLYQAFQQFTVERVKRGIAVDVIAIGEGGEEAMLSQRKWLTKNEGSPTYILIYADKVAMISVNKEKEPLGLIIEDKALFKTQLQLFNFIWKSLT